jgi:hypothetical protein
MSNFNILIKALRMSCNLSRHSRFPAAEENSRNGRKLPRLRCFERLKPSAAVVKFLDTTEVVRRRAVNAARASSGGMIRAYNTLMEYWRCVLPEGVMLDMRYEKLVADFERQARRIIAHCGLEWDNACLAYDKTARPIKTASAAQIRQPITAARSGVGVPTQTCSSLFWMG